MGLLERVSTLIRPNINDLVDRSEKPEKKIQKVILALGKKVFCGNCWPALFALGACEMSLIVIPSAAGNLS